MKAKYSLRAASVIMFLHDIGHTFGAMTWKHTIDPDKQEVVRQMTIKKFSFMGAVRSMGEFYDGYGFAATLALLLIAIILWIISSAEEGNNTMKMRIIITLSIILLAWGIDELIFFFPFAASFSLLACLLCFYSYFQLNKNQ
jgi:hypothetical protein